MFVLSEKSEKDQLPGKPNQDLDFVTKLLEVLEETPAFSENFSESGQRQAQQEEGEMVQVESNKSGTPSSGGDRGVCEETNPSAKVRVCLPQVEAGGSNLYLAGQEIFSEKYCYTR